MRLGIIFKDLLFVAFLFLFTSCQEENIHNADISRAKAFFEDNAKNLSLPLFGNTNEDLREMASSVAPFWEDAIYSNQEGFILVEAPLSGACRIVASIVNIHDGLSHVEIATVKSYLVVGFNDNEPQPQIYVETFIQQGKQCNMTARSDRTGILGFVIISDLDGAIRANQSIRNGQVSTTGKVADLAKADRIKGDFIGYRAGYATVTKDHIGCPDYSLINCPFCHEQVMVNVSDPEAKCPTCGAYIFGGEYFCPECGRPVGQCTCMDDNVCGPCGRNKLNCNGCSDTSIYCECE